MAIPYDTDPGTIAIAPMTVFERYLSVWVFLCIVAGIALGQLIPGVVQTVGRLEIARVNLPVGLLIWVRTRLMFVAAHPITTADNNNSGISFHSILGASTRASR